ncbi:putative RTM1-like protein [Aspergillus uvarum CBS 121591]|uniref:Putative RTM1-like protein n=1 Tax=Aspergillus uvarum CBS 121591 TaxID=1448315 RepID=A0A319BU59_9EURO|nr:putative RTM1-like protein [Aspergillus uvarum CBS 121591]PYH77206.1 putative RTM1-like protein [Aspergillus uvarum CBS 121591]
MATEDSEFKLYRYDPSIGAAVIFIILFLAAAGIHTFQVVRTKAWFVIPFVVGGHFEWIGYIGRAVSGAEAPDFTVKPYIVQTLLLLIAPTLFAAAVYMELGRIVLLTNGEAYCLIRRTWLTKTFLLGDIVSFLMQGAGGGIMASGTPSNLTTGEHIIIGGLVVQLIFFSLFVITSMKFHHGLSNAPSRRVLHLQAPWERHMYALYGGSALIFVRSLFRLIEYAQGNDGYLVSHEAFLYIFDALLMVLVMVLFAWVHPSEVHALLTPGGRGKAAERVFWLKMEGGESLS